MSEAEAMTEQKKPFDRQIDEKALEAAVLAYDCKRCEIHGAGEKPMSQRNRESIAPMIAAAIAAYEAAKGADPARAGINEAFEEVARWHDKNARLCLEASRDDPRLNVDDRRRALEAYRHHTASAAAIRARLIWEFRNHREVARTKE